MQNLRFKTCYRVEIIKPDQVFLLDDLGNRHLLDGASYVKLAPFLIGKKPIPEKLLLEPEIAYALLRLEKNGFIEENKKYLPKPLSAFCHLLECLPEEAAKELKKKSVSLFSFGKASPVPLEKILKSLGIRRSKHGNLSIVITDSYKRKELQNLGRKLYKKGIPWLLIKPLGAEIWLGPLFVSGKSGCYECLLECLVRNEEEDLYIEKQTNKTHLSAPIAHLPTMEPLAYNLAANEVFKWIVKQESKLFGKIFTFNSCVFSWTSHSFIQRHECKVCGSPDAKQEPFPLILKSQSKSYTGEGGYRVISPEETVKKYEHLVSPVTGIVHFLTPFSLEGNPYSHQYVAGHSIENPRFSDRPYFENKRTAAGGKGKSDGQAKASCLCEAIERFSGVFQGTELRKKFSYEEIAKDAIHPYSLLLFSEKQYQERKNCDPKNDPPFLFIPSPFREREKIDWTPIWSLTENRFKWLPTACSYYSYPFANPEEQFCRCDSNGCAAGNTKEEAILQGFFELVERDSAALWWYSRLSRPGVDLKSFADPYFDQLIAHSNQSNRKFWALDLTMDLAIPAFALISHYPNADREEICIGLGAHFDPLIALQRAVTEMHQMEWVGRKKNQTDTWQKNWIFRNWFEKAKLADHPYLQPNASLPFKKKSDYPYAPADDLREDVLRCQQRVEAKGLEMLVLDQTRPDIGLPVVRVVIPGLRHFWNRFAAGRLYDIPVQLGFLNKPLTEKDLNPIPFFL